MNPKEEHLRTRLHSVREVRVPVPEHLSGRVRWFYERLLQVRAWSAEDQLPGGWGIGLPRQGVFFEWVHEIEADPMKRRFVMLVASLELCAKRLTEHDYPFDRFRGLFFTDQWIEITDPAGHRVEIRASSVL